MGKTPALKNKLNVTFLGDFGWKSHKQIIPCLPGPLGESNGIMNAKVVHTQCKCI